MNQQRSGFGIAYDELNQIIYAMGGYNGKQWLNQCEQYSVQEDKWTVISPMRKKKGYLSACIVATSCIYVIGGYNGTRLNDIERYTITTDIWDKIEPKGVQMPARSYPFSFAINLSQILIAGGYQHEILKDSYILDTSDNTLTATSNLPQTDLFRSPSATVIDSNLYCVSYYDNIYKYRVEDQKWEKIDQL